MKKNITIIGINYYPEDSAIGLYTTQKAEFLMSKGYDVSVITGFPYYPHWEINKTYLDKSKWYKEVINNITIYRYKQYVPGMPSFFKRVLHLLSFTFGSFINLFKVKKPDAIICIVPFTSSILLGWLLKIRYKSKLWVHIQDFEFDAAIDSGLLNKNKAFIIRLLLWLEKSLLKKADITSSISNGMLQKLCDKINTDGYYLTNWLDTSSFNNNALQHKYLLSNKFKILYSGNIGAKQDWDFFFFFLDKLCDKSDLEVIVVGEGAERHRIEEEIKNYDFANYFPPVPYEELAQLLSSADLHILFQKDEVIDTVMPSKILGMMGSGKPSIVTGNSKSEVKQIFDKSNAGFYYGNNQLDEIVEQIETLKSSLSLRNDLGKSAKSFVIQNYSKEIVLNKFLKELNKLLQP